MSGDNAGGSKYVSARQIAREYDVNPETVLAWHRRGWIPGYQMGGRVIRFDPTEVRTVMIDRANKGNSNA